MSVKAYWVLQNALQQVLVPCTVLSKLRASSGVVA